MPELNPHFLATKTISITLCCVRLKRWKHISYIWFLEKQGHTSNTHKSTAMDKQRKTDCFWPGAIFEKWSNLSEILLEKLYLRCAFEFSFNQSAQRIFSSLSYISSLKKLL